MTKDMTHGHAHGPAHGNKEGNGHGDRNARGTLIALILTGGFLVVEIAGGLLSGSLALLADAGHMATDTASLLLAWTAFRISRRPHDAGKSFGYYRFEVIAAFVNALAMFVLIGWIVFEAYARIFDPRPVLAGPMLAVALTGLAVNIAAFAALHRADRGNLNIRAASLHVLGDLLGSLAALIAAIVIMATGWTAIDPLLSLLVALLLFRGALSLIRHTGHILMEGAPGHIDTAEMSRKMVAAVPGLIGVHHVHVWLLTAERPLLTAHLALAGDADSDAALDSAKTFLLREYGIAHTTLQIERAYCPDQSSATNIAFR